MKKVLIIGAGGHGKVVYDTLCCLNEFVIVGFADEKKPIGSIVIDNCKVVSNVTNVSTIQFDYFVMAIGDNSIRSKLFNSLIGSNNSLTIIHPMAVVSKFSTIGEGSVILANSTIQAGAKIGKNVIVNANCLIDHDSVIGDHSHIAQGTVVGSECELNNQFKSEIGQLIVSRTNL